MTSAPVELAPEPVHDDVTWVSSYDVNPFEVPTADKAALLVDWTDRLRTGAAVDHASAHLQQVQENKFYADLAGTRTTQQRVRVHPGLRGDGRRRGHASTRCGASRRRSAAAGSTSPRRRYDWDDEIDQVPELLAEKLKAPSVEAGTLRPGHPPLEPVADHPRVDRARHRARPGARLRGELRGHVVRDLRQARHAAVRRERS